MAVKDWIPEVEALIAAGATTTGALEAVAKAHGTTRMGMQTAYYKDRRARGFGRPRNAAHKKTRAPRARRAAPTRGEFVPKAPQPATNGKISGTTEELMARLRRNVAEHDEILTALERAVSEDLAALSRVRSVLHA